MSFSQKGGTLGQKSGFHSSESWKSSKLGDLAASRIGRNPKRNIEKRNLKVGNFRFAYSAVYKLRLFNIGFDIYWLSVEAKVGSLE